MILPKRRTAFIGFPAARIWWEYDKIEYEPGFVDQIDSELSRRDPLEVERLTRQTLDESGASIGVERRMVRLRRR